MQEPDLILEFEIEEGRSPDIENVARALLSWNEALQAAFEIIAPNQKVIVELVGVEAGSQRFKQVFRLVEGFANALEEGGQEYPLIWKHTKALAKCVAGGVLLAGIANEMAPDVRLPDDQMAVFEEIRDLLRSDPTMDRSRHDFFETLHEEPAISLVEVYEEGADKPLYSVSRSEFSFKAGLFDIEDEIEELREEDRYHTWDVVLIRPVLVSTPRRWTFARDGVEFSALMADPTVLEAIQLKTLDIPFAEGVTMKIEVTYREHYDGKTWRPINKSRKVTKVLSPRITLPPGALFADTY